MAAIPLRDGRTVDIADDHATIELRSPAGAVELRIRVTPDGPVVTVDAARLELTARDAVAISSRRVAIRATESLELASDGEASVDARGDVRVTGALIYLN
jgi:hypothetical protein|nr:hypothetical protein [Kofleriaceae bacterium]